MIESKDFPRQKDGSLDREKFKKMVWCDVIKAVIPPLTIMMTSGEISKEDYIKYMKNAGAVK